MIRSVSILLVAMVLAGCARIGSPADHTGMETEISDPQSSLVIRAHLKRNEIGVADRLKVQVELRWSPPDTATLVEPDFSQSGWTLIDEYHDPVRVSGSGFEETNTFVIEPFLPGKYRVPSFVAQIYTGPDTDTHELGTAPMSVHVVSVLDANDSGELDEPDGLLDPSSIPTPSSHHHTAIYATGATIFALATLIVWRLSRSSDPIEAHQSIYAQLEEIANNPEKPESDGYDALYRALSNLDPRLQQTSEIRSLIEHCERARFSQSDAPAHDPRTLARHTLELLGAASGEPSNEVAA